MGDIGDGNDPGSLLSVNHPKGFVQSQLAHAEILIELHHVFHKFFHRTAGFQPFAQGTDPVPDPFIKQLSPAGALIVADDLAVPGIKNPVKYFQIIVIQLLETDEVVPGHLIDASPYLSHDLAGRAESVLLIDQQKGKIIMPEIPGKAVGPRQLHKAA